MNKAEREEKLIARLAEMQKFENELRGREAAQLASADDVAHIAGVDEVGRGPLAGPVCAACVVLPKDFSVLGVDDSKKISEKKREALYDEITSAALAWGIGLVDNRRIDEINILNATKEAMLAAIAEANDRLKTASQIGDVNRNSGGDSRSAIEEKTAHGIDHILIDAVALPEAEIPFTAIIKGDAQSVSIAAASIIAKVTRDRMMVAFGKVYSGYAFAQNKGYGTKAHYEGIQKLGLTPIHRRSFVRGFY
jgi:ribonuclease HII